MTYRMGVKSDCIFHTRDEAAIPYEVVIRDWNPANGQSWHGKLTATRSFGIRNNARTRKGLVQSQTFPTFVLKSSPSNSFDLILWLVSGSASTARTVVSPPKPD